MNPTQDFEFTKSRVIPVLVIEDASWSLDLASTLVEAGLPIVEVTLRTKASWDALTMMREVPGLVLAVGSVSSIEDLTRANDLQVDFAVSAGIRSDLIEKAFELELAYIPGVSTPSEVLLGIKHGLTTLKWFPAETLGGVPALKAISAPFPSLRFIPTGGINSDNGRNYLEEKSVKAIGGSWMFPKQALLDKDLSTISRLAQQASLL
jgi:2-dehydro-3-deoxyphosphogluconate aldolase / (4S)-4-hydroxy-2-oxoglutarate aldolase